MYEEDVKGVYTLFRVTRRVLVSVWVRVHSCGLVIGLECVVVVSDWDSVRGWVSV